MFEKDKVIAFMKKLKLWKSNLEMNNLDMFSFLNDLWGNANFEEKNLFLENLDDSVPYFSNDFEDLDFSKYMWVQNPFNCNEGDEFELKTV